MDVFELDEVSSFIVEVLYQSFWKPIHFSDDAKINAMVINQARSSKIAIFGDSKGHVMYESIKHNL